MTQTEERFRRHDDFQFEMKLEYSLRPDTRRERYRIETFFFLPNNLDVNENTYSRRDFYRDLLLYIRFKTPELPLAAIADPGNPLSPLTRLANGLARGKEGDAPALEREMRLLGCVLKSSLRHHTMAFDQRAEGSVSDGKGALSDIDLFLRETKNIASGFRKLKTESSLLTLSPQLSSTFAHADEFMSLLIEGSAHRLLQTLSRLPGRPAPREAAALLADLVREESDYRRKSGVPSLVAENSDNEVFLYRLSVLKKFISSVLHLSVRTEEQGQGLKQFALAVGAGLAMVFAAGVALTTQQIYGALSFTFFLALVVSYMFKDRIKAVSQKYLMQALSRRLHDLQTNIFDPLSGEKLGVCQESAQFREESKLDPRVVHLRNRDHITDIENDWRSEKVIQYVKEVTLFSPQILRDPSRRSGLTDIARFNVRNFLLKMDEPVSELLTLQGNASRAIQGTRVYHVNLVIKFSSREKTTYDRLRLVLTRNGIKRLETVSSETVPPG